MPAKIFVTGGAGYIGAIAVEELINQGYLVDVFDNLKRGYESYIHPQAKLYSGDLRSILDLETALKASQPDAVIHFASLALVKESFDRPELYYKNNVTGSLNLFRTAIKHQVKNFIFSSSCAVYGQQNTIPINESASPNPLNPYGETKLAIEKMLNWLAQKHQLNTVALRYFNAAGASLDGKRGEAHHPETHLIPNVFKAAVKGTPLNIFGHDYPTPDGTCVRDYIHVVDLVRAHILVLEKLLAGQKIRNLYNIGTGNGTSNNEIVKKVQQVTGKQITVNYLPRRSGDAAILVADPTAINRDLNFSPQYSDLDTIIKTAWQWYSNPEVQKIYRPFED